jgi:phosphoribosylformylglycinamidine synthase
VSAYRIEIRVMPRPTLLDPQGQAVEHALQALGFGDVSQVRVGKHVVLNLDAPTREAAAEQARLMCDRLLANPVTEDYHLHVEAGA